MLFAPIFQFLEDTEYDKEGSSEIYNIIPFDGPTDWLPDEVNMFLLYIMVIAMLYLLSILLLPFNFVPIRVVYYVLLTTTFKLPLNN